MAKQASAVIRWVFTWNNYVEADIEYLKTLDLQFLHVGKEVGESGTPHLQGYLELKKKKRHPFVKSLIKGNWCQPARGDANENRVYTGKEDLVIDIGNPGVSGKKKLYDAVHDALDGKSHRDLVELHGDQYIRNKRKIDEVVSAIILEDSVKKMKLRSGALELRPWQEELRLVIVQQLEECDNRKINWVYDQEGNMGKTTMAGYLESTMDAITFENGKSADIAFLYSGQKLCLFDYSRSQSEHINYGILESVKNGRVMSTKYQCVFKCFPPPVVVVFANFEPKWESMSADRWNFIEIKKDITYTRVSLQYYR